MKTEKQKFEGEYYTPLNFVRELHEYIKDLQPDYLEFPTWDPAAGAQHLTKEFDYRHLASSTLNDNEADVQYDYLNGEELPEAIKCVIEQGKKEGRFNFICNPPYAAAGNNKRDSESKTGVTFTKTRELIQAEKTHTCFARNLSTQFLWRTIKFYEDNPEIKEGYIIWIDKLNYLSSSSFTKLRERLFSLFDFLDGFMIDAGHFDGIKKGSWSIGFSIFKLNREKGKVNLDGGEVSGNKGFKYLNPETYFPHMTSSLNVIQDLKYKIDKKSFGILLSNANHVEKNGNSVWIINGPPKMDANISNFTKDNYKSLVEYFCARRLIVQDSFNYKDEYMKPSDTILASDEYKQWSNDCIIYSLFDNQSFQSSLRQVDYQSKKWDIKNEFFWMSKDDIAKLAKTHLNSLVANDLANDEERYVYTEIERIKGETITFSKEALDLLNYMTKIVKETFPLRLNSNKSHHFNSWDAGYAQIKLYMTKEQKDEMKKLRDALANKLRPKVYYFGFLYDSNYPHWTDDLPFIVEVEGELYDFVDSNWTVLTRGEFERLCKQSENE